MSTPKKATKKQTTTDDVRQAENRLFAAYLARMTPEEIQDMKKLMDGIIRNRPQARKAVER